MAQNFFIYTYLHKNGIKSHKIAQNTYLLILITEWRN